MRLSTLFVSTGLAFSSFFNYANNLSLKDCYGVVALSRVDIPFQSFLKSERQIPQVILEQDDENFLLSEGSPGLPLFTIFNSSGSAESEAPGYPDVLKVHHRAHQEVKVGSFAFIQSKDGKVLMIRKWMKLPHPSKGKVPGIYYIPGGLYEKGNDKNLEETVVREVKEETDFDIVGSLKQLFMYESVLPSSLEILASSGVRAHNLMKFYVHLWKKNSSEFVIKPEFLIGHDEICEVKWMTPREFFEMYASDKSLSTPSMEFLMKQYLFLLSGGQYKPYKFESKSKLAKRTDGDSLE